MNSWKRRWCVLKDETFLWFRSKQEALKQGWLHKKGGGSSTLSRRNWKKLMYFENDSEEKLKGTVEVRTAKYVDGACMWSIGWGSGLHVHVH
jgi:myosin X